jgi:hypothetical protein
LGKARPKHTIDVTEFEIYLESSRCAAANVVVVDIECTAPATYVCSAPALDWFRRVSHAVPWPNSAALRHHDRFTDMLQP